MNGESSGMLAEWLALMDNDPIRLMLTAGVGGMYAFAAWAFGEIPVARKIPAEARRFLFVVWAALGVVVGFFASVAVPGLRVMEVIGALGLGGGSTRLIHGGRKKLEAAGVVPPRPPVRRATQATVDTE